MALVFQYGSNMSTKRLNSVDRLNGFATFKAIAYTKDKYDLVFDIWSNTNKSATANIVNSSGNHIWGVVYIIPNKLIERGINKSTKCLDEIEGEGSNYRREQISLLSSDGEAIEESVITYTGLNRRQDIKTSLAYVTHLLNGLKEHSMPNEYVEYVKRQIIKNNSELESSVLNAISLNNCHISE
jgi:gamma-glutamylcyclotransferase (GGCT)/AIG2-like uncharacterized protein YtfP